MTSSWDAFFSDSLEQLDAAQMRRRLQVHSRDGLIDFGSNDYLGLRADPAVCAAAAEVAGGVWGSGASPVLHGYQTQHAALESALADWSHTQSALVFSSGFACNAGVVACLATTGDLIISDRLNHASLIDGCRLSRAEKVVYPHLDVAFVREFLGAERHRYGRVLIISESIFSMDGDAAPLRELADIADQFDCGLVVDEAHGAGVYGQSGSGLIEEYGLGDRVLVKLGTLSKALGSIGGYLCGSHALSDFVVNRCRSYLFSTAPPAAAMAAATAALQRLRAMQPERAYLRGLAVELRQQLEQSGLANTRHDSPIVPVVVGSAERALRLSMQLADRGMYVPAIRPPTVPPGTSRLRVSLSAAHSRDDIARLIEGLRELL